MFLNRFGTFVVPFLTIYLAARGYSAKEARSTVAAYGAGHLLACFIGGWLAGTLGRRKTIVASMLFAAAATLAPYRAEGLPLILFCSGLTGLMAEFHRPAASALLTDLVPPRRRLIGLHDLSVGAQRRFAIGPATAGFLATVSFGWPFIGDAATSLLF